MSEVWVLSSESSDVISPITNDIDVFYFNYHFKWEYILYMPIKHIYSNVNMSYIGISTWDINNCSSTSWYECEINRTHLLFFHVIQTLLTSNGNDPSVISM